MKMIRRIITLVLAVLMVMSLGTTAFAAGDTYVATQNVVVTPLEENRAGDGTSVDSLFVPFKKTWAGDEAYPELRPESIKVSLYEYTETLDTTKIEPVETKVVTGPAWETTFNLSGRSMVNENGIPYKYAIVEEKVPGYVETAHVDPNVKFVPPSSGDWESIRPCDKLDLRHSGDTKGIAIINKGSNYWVWSPAALSQEEKDLIVASFTKYDMSGREIQWCIGNDTFDMLQGESFTVTENGMVTFSNKNAWTWLYTGTYIKSTGTATPAAITNTLEKVDIPVEKIWEDNNNAAGIRPDSITVKLFADGVVVQDKIAEGEEEKLVDKILTLNEENGWAGVFTNLLKYQKDGVTPIEYTVAEEAVKGYNGTIAWKDGKWFITNELANTTVSITKQITGSMGDRSKEFYIYVTFDREVGDGEGYTVEGEGKNIAKFKLTDDGHVTIQNVPVDAKITGITETDVNGNVLDSGWKMNLWKPEIGEGNGVALPLDVDDTGLTLTIENNKEGTPDTGVLLDSLPYVLILGLVAVGAFFFLRKRRNDED